MHKPLAIALTLTAGVLAATAPALAAPVDQVCGYAEVLRDSGIQSANQYMEKMAGHWSDAQREQLTVAVGAQMARFNYRDALIYRTADIPDVAEEYFLVLRLKSTGAVYLRMFFEGNEVAEPLIEVDFKSSYYAATQAPFFQDPEPVTCP
ncbi:hypothetical protein [Cucumibacter marinus]|uniref:hypothetical protein n=1 Tax=Cucumibacter marinus TaxID=1121252 RepID=UPI00041AD333|nr:hypothetical protein [Cucumibacter marinus]